MTRAACCVLSAVAAALRAQMSISWHRFGLVGAQLTAARLVTPMSSCRCLRSVAPCPCTADKVRGCVRRTAPRIRASPTYRLKESTMGDFIFRLDLSFKLKF